MRKIFIALMCVVLTAISPSVIAADEPIWTVAVHHSGEDMVGQKLAFALREAIRGSHGYKLVTGPTATLNISLITLNPDERNQSNWTIASVGITMRNFNPYKEGEPHTWYPIYLQGGLFTAGTNRVNNISQDILSLVDSSVENLKKDIGLK